MAFTACFFSSTEGICSSLPPEKEAFLPTCRESGAGAARPWSSNWTININTQMNYWHAQSCNLGGVCGALFPLYGKNL